VHFGDALFQALDSGSFCPELRYVVWDSRRQRLCYAKEYALDQGEHLAHGRLVDSATIKRSDPELDIWEYAPTYMYNGQATRNFQD
jgi:hypothetical protein